MSVDRILRSLSGLVLLGVVFASTARAQQFGSVTNFPGTTRWSEGVECADVDLDGDLDAFFADGEGFASAGTARQHQLMINKFVETGPWTFVDESVARLGVHTSVAKGVTTGDVNGDGWVDALFVSAFLTAAPALYINQGAANPGFFTFEGAARGLTANYSSGSAQFGDLDDDGDLDLILGDAYNSGVASKPHLYFNDGTGVFTENAAALGALNKTSQMDVQLVDIDNDFDLDFLGANKSTTAPAQYLMLNNGAGSFTDVSSRIAVSSGNAYEAEAGDLDNDSDLDLFFVSMTGFQEGSIRNNLVGLGTQTFTNQSALGGTVDDNEIVLFDYDVDGDYDVVVGSLGSHEFLYRNNGALSFADLSAQIQVVGDPTLDCTVADLNNDGKYDIVTAQGEGSAAQWANKFYRNTGVSDTLPPVLVAQSVPPSAPSAGPVVLRAKIRDQVLDDGVNYVTATANYVVNVTHVDAAVSVNGASFTPDPLVISAGATVTWTNNTGAACTVQSATAPWTFASGALAIGATYSRAFVTPGSYTITSTPGGATSTITVTGSAAAAVATYSGGQIYRFRCDDTQDALGSELVYELRFQDWAGNVTISDSGAVALVRPGPGELFCGGDGIDPAVTTACPCANFGAPGHGCAHSFSAAGALLRASGTTSPDTVVLATTNTPSSSFGLYMQHDAADDRVFHDGVLCANGALIRLRGRASAGGASQFPDPAFAQDATLTLSQRGLVTPGSGARRYYATWYRNASTTYCPPATANVTNGWILDW